MVTLNWLIVLVKEKCHLRSPELKLRKPCHMVAPNRKHGYSPYFICTCVYFVIRNKPVSGGVKGHLRDIGNVRVKEAWGCSGQPLDHNPKKILGLWL